MSKIIKNFAAVEERLNIAENGPNYGKYVEMWKVGYIEGFNLGVRDGIVQMSSKIQELLIATKELLFKNKD